MSRAAVRLGLVLGLVLFLAPGESTGGLRSLTTPQELVLGQSFAEAVDARFPILGDPVLQWYTNLRGRQLADRSARNNIPYFFRVVESPEINAFAIPGGHVYINLGIFQVADHEAELLGIVAHEVGHIVGRHSAKQIIQQQWASIGLAAGIGAYPNYYAYLAGNLFGEVGFLKLSRDAEREADQIGFQILVDSGYDPQAMVRMFEKLRERYQHEPGRLEKLFLTHPPTEERIENLKKLLAETALPAGLGLDSPEFREVKLRVTELYPTPQIDEKEMKDKAGRRASR
jgi:predicted Zn-dependent protease